MGRGTESLSIENTPTVAMADEKPAVTGDDAEARKAEVKARMAADAAKAAEAKKKKGFMTPARKSKLRMLLRKKAAEELKKEEERKKEERRRVVVERCGVEKSLDVPIEGLRTIVEEYYKHILETESTKYDLELKLVYNDFIINDLTQKVTDLRGKFVKPTLKKVSKFEDKAELSKGDEKPAAPAAPAEEGAPAEE